MQPISNTLDAFQKAVESGAPVACDQAGNWYVEGTIKDTISWLFNHQINRIDSVISAFNASIDTIERQKSRKKLKNYYKPAVALLNHYGNASNIWELARRIRSIECNTRGFRQEPWTDQDQQEIRTMAVEWKRRRLHLESDELTNFDESQFKKLQPYRVFAETLGQYKHLQDAFFDWTLRDGLDPAPFIELPATTSHIAKSHYLTARLGIYDLLKYDRKSKELFIVNSENQINVRQLDFSMTFSNNYNATTGFVLDDFALRSKRVGTFEITSQGVINWHSTKIGPYNPETKNYDSINIDQSEWWKQFPYMKEWSEQELVSRIKLDWNGVPLKLDGKHWIVSVVVNTADPKDLLLENTHGYSLIAIPTGQNSYQIYPFGMFIKQDWPQTLSEKVGVAMSYVPGAVAYPDENFLRTDRVSDYIAASVLPHDAHNIMEKIRSDIKRCWEGNMPYQLFNRNCIHWAVNLVKDHIPLDYFDAIGKVCPLTLKKGGGAYEPIVRSYQRLPKWLITPILNQVAHTFGASKVMEVDGQKYRFEEHLPWSNDKQGFLNPSVMILTRRGRFNVQTGEFLN